MAVRFNQKLAAKRGYTKADWDEVSDNPRITRADIAKAKPFKEALPELYDSIQRSRGRPPVDNPKEAVTLRLDPDVVARFKAKGSDWRTRMAAILEKAS